MALFVGCVCLYLSLNMNVHKCLNYQLKWVWLFHFQKHQACRLLCCDAASYEVLYSFLHLNKKQKTLLDSGISNENYRWIVLHLLNVVFIEKQRQPELWLSILTELHPPEPQQSFRSANMPQRNTIYCVEKLLLHTSKGGKRACKFGKVLKNFSHTL